MLLERPEMVPFRLTQNCVAAARADSSGWVHSSWVHWFSHRRNGYKEKKCMAMAGLRFVGCGFFPGFCLCVFLFFFFSYFYFPVNPKVGPMEHGPLLPRANWGGGGALRASPRLIPG